MKHKTQSKRITRKLNELRSDAWRRMHDPLADQHRWYISVLRGHCAYYGLPHNWRALAGFRQQLRRIWFTCLKRRSQRSRRAGWDWFDAVKARLPSATSADNSFLGGATHMARVTFGKSRVRECRMLGSVRAKPNG